ncbi:hypothetical protein OIU76_015445 [Salix suchowensis]|nr:hypothetical protein OIU76_015445 [Salix suchowensis]
MDDFGSMSHGIDTIVLIYVERDGRCLKLTDVTVGFAFCVCLGRKVSGWAIAEGHVVEVECWIECLGMDVDRAFGPGKF